MAGDWMTAKIGDCFDLVGGYAFKSGEFIESGIPVIKIKNVKANRMLFDDLSYVAPEFLKTRTEKVVQKGDLLITMSGNRFDGSPDTWVGKVAQFNEDRPFMLNQRVGILRPKKGAEVDRRFFAFSLSSHFYQTEFIAIATSSGGQANLSPSQILGAPIEYPPLAEQKAIAAVLGALDDKIELNRRMNATLEAMARALFQSWFVDFDPVRAKLDGRPLPNLDPATAALFPDSFQDSPLGPIPRGWKVKSIGDVTTRVTKGDTPRSEAVLACPKGDRMVPMLRVNAITEDGEVLMDKAEFIPESIHLGKSKRSILEENDILYTNAGTIGRVALVQKEFLPANTNQAMAIVRPNPSLVPSAFLYMVMRQPEFQKVLHHDIVHAVQANLALGKISDARAVFPPIETIKRLSDPIVALLNQVFKNRQQSRTLATLRHTLLPKLLSGELRLTKAARVAQERAL